jgi:dihydroxyacetone kinase
MVDALVPFSSELTQQIDAGARLADAWRVAADAATRAAVASAELLPRMGRARTHGEHSLGTPDPGAVSLALLATAVADVIAAGGVVDTTAGAGENALDTTAPADLDQPFERN